MESWRIKEIFAQKAISPETKVGIWGLSMMIIRSIVNGSSNGSVLVRKRFSICSALSNRTKTIIINDNFSTIFSSMTTLLKLSVYGMSCIVPVAMWYPVDILRWWKQPFPIPERFWVNRFIHHIGVYADLPRIPIPLPKRVGSCPLGIP